MKNKRKPFFNCVKGILRIFKHKPKIISLCDNLPEQALFLSNHVGAMAPLTHELYLPRPFKFWGTYEMCGNYKSLYNYLSKIYFYKKKGINKFFSKIIAVIATPIMHGIYKGMQIIPTYPDARMKITIGTSLEEFKQGKSILVFPEDSHDGYHDILTHYFHGFFKLAKYAFEKLNLNLPIINMYYYKKKNTLLIDKPKYYEDLVNSGKSEDEIVDGFKERANEMFLSFKECGSIDNALQLVN